MAVTSLDSIELQKSILQRTAKWGGECTFDLMVWHVRLNSYITKRKSCEEFLLFLFKSLAFNVAMHDFTHKLLMQNIWNIISDVLLNLWKIYGQRMQQKTFFKNPLFTSLKQKSSIVYNFFHLYFFFYFQKLSKKGCASFLPTWKGIVEIMLAVTSAVAECRRELKRLCSSFFW